jgi:hypothetical protein
MHQSLQGARFHLEHIIPQSRGGATELINLAWACPGCNLRKSDRTEAVDIVTGQLSPLFHPRQDDWNEHFAWRSFEVTALSATGRVTIATLDLNHSRRILIRQVEASFGLFPN